MHCSPVPDAGFVKTSPWDVMTAAAPFFSLNYVSWINHNCGVVYSNDLLVLHLLIYLSRPKWNIDMFLKSRYALKYMSSKWKHAHGIDASE